MLGALCSWPSMWEIRLLIETDSREELDRISDQLANVPCPANSSVASSLRSACDRPGRFSPSATTARRPGTVVPDARPLGAHPLGRGQLTPLSTPGGAAVPAICAHGVGRRSGALSAATGLLVGRGCSPESRARPQAVDPARVASAAILRGPLQAMMGWVTPGRSYDIRLTGWRRIALRIVSVPTVSNVVGWFDCSVPGTRGRLRKLWEPWR